MLKANKNGRGKKYFNVKSYSQRVAIVCIRLCVSVWVCDAIVFSWHSIKMLNNYTLSVYIETSSFTHTLNYFYIWFLFPSLVQPILHDSRSQFNQSTFSFSCEIHRHMIYIFFFFFFIHMQYVVYFVFEKVFGKSKNDYVLRMNLYTI